LRDKIATQQGSLRGLAECAIVIDAVEALNFVGGAAVGLVGIGKILAGTNRTITLGWLLLLPVVEKSSGISGCLTTSGRVVIG